MRVLSPGRSLRRRALLPTVCLSLLALVAALPASASAMLVGIESNSEFVNSDRTPAMHSKALDKAKTVGAQVIRGNVGWSDVASNCAGQSIAALRDNTNPCYSWGVLDDLVTQSKDRGIQLLFSVSRTPRWVLNSTNTSYVGTTSPQYNKFVANYTAFITAIVTRYGAKSTIGTVRYWTIWNEPNSRTFWEPLSTAAQARSAPLRYAVLYAKAAVALKTANPSALVAPGPTGPNSKPIRPITYIKQLQPYLAKYLPGTGYAERRYINAWAHNPYPGNFAPPATIYYKSPAVGIGNISDLFRQLDAAPVTRRLPVWATEFGFQTSPPDRQLGVSYSRQAQFIPEAFDLLDATKRVTVAIQYGLTDPTALIDWQSGLYTSAGRAKPSVAAFQRMVSVSASSLRRGMRVGVWARANTNPKATRLQFSYDGRTWRTLIAPRRANGSIRASLRMTRTTWFATYDGKLRGPARVVLAR